MKHSELLTKAKAHLYTDYTEYNADFGWRNTDKNPFICNAVKIAAGGSAGLCPAVTQEAADVIDYIDELLGGRCTFMDWLREVHGIHADHCSRTDFNQLQATRLAWIDDMIAFWQAEGK